MSVYIHQKSKDGVYRYDFKLDGERYSGSTGKTRRREAVLEEARIRDEARRELAKRKAIVNAAPDTTIEQACERYWLEKKYDFTEAGRPDSARQLAWLVEHFGPSTRLSEIGDAEVARMVAARRGENIPNRKQPKLVSKTTVNRTATLPLRRIMNRAYLVWKIPLQIINWREHLLDEPQERVREATEAEEATLLDRLERGYGDVVRFAMMVGARRMECLGMVWTDVDFINATVRLRGKGGTILPVPLPPEARELLWSLRHDHPTQVFTYLSNQTRRLNNGELIERGKRYPITKFSLRQAFDRARKQAGLVDFRFHDTRHTAATRLLRKTGNLRLAQQLLRHSDIATTAKYAHVTMQDLANAMATLYPAKSGREQTGAKSPKLFPNSTVATAPKS